MPIALALDVGGTKVEAALVEADGRILPGSRFREPTGRAADAATLFGAVRRVVTAALPQLPSGERLAGVGIGSAGPILLPDGSVSPLNLPGWRAYPLRQRVGELVPGVPVRLALDGLCITLAEHWLGAARGADTVLGMIVSTGIGGGLLVGGRPLRGATGNAGHIGQVEVGGFTAEGVHGGPTTLERIASGPGTVAWARSQGWSGTSGEELGAAYQAGEALAVAAVRRAGRAIGRAIASATALVDLDVVVIGGGFAQVTPDLFDFIRASLRDDSEFPFTSRAEVRPTGLSGDGPLLGAAALVLLPGLAG